MTSTGGIESEENHLLVLIRKEIARSSWRYHNCDTCAIGTICVGSDLAIKTTAANDQPKFLKMEK